MSETLLMTIHDVIRETGLSRHTVYRLAKMGEAGRPGGLPVVRCGRALRFSRRELEAWIEEGGAEHIAGMTGQ